MLHFASSHRVDGSYHCVFLGMRVDLVVVDAVTVFMLGIGMGMCRLSDNSIDRL